MREEDTRGSGGSHPNNARAVMLKEGAEVGENASIEHRLGLNVIACDYVAQCSQSW